MHLEQTPLNERLAPAVPILGEHIEELKINQLLWIRLHILVLWLIELSQNRINLVFSIEKNVLHVRLLKFHALNVL